MNKYCDKHGQLQPCVECLSGYAAMGGSFVVKQATPPDELIKQLMDSRVPKTEREHAAAAEIDSLRQRLAAAEALLNESARDLIERGHWPKKESGNQWDQWLCLLSDWKTGGKG